MVVEGCIFAKKKSHVKEYPFYDLWTEDNVSFMYRNVLHILYVCAKGGDLFCTYIMK